MFSIALRRIVFALGVSGPIQSEAVAHQPLRKVNAINRTYRNRSPVLVKAHGRAINGPSRDEGVKALLVANEFLEAQISQGYMRGVKHGRFKTYNG
jgi:hypothetical protein